MTRTIRLALVLAVAATATIALDDTRLASAQPAMALGRPLPDQALPTGTVTVRVIQGSTSVPGAGVAVSVVVNGTSREARTNADGRVTFPDLAPGATVKVSAPDADGKPIESEEFNVPSEGGVRVMLSTKPFIGGSAGAAPPITSGAPSAPTGPMMGGGAGGMPEARAISGTPKPDGTNAAGTYSVRLTYNNLTFGASGPEDKAPPVGEKVYLVGLAYDDTVKVLSADVDAAGNTKFEGLDTTGGTAYYAIASLKRGTNIDRLIAEPVTLGPQGGARVVLSGLKRDATDPGVDDYQRAEKINAVTPPAGKVRISLDGLAKPGFDVALIDATTMQPLVKTKATATADPSRVEPSVDLKPLPDQPGLFDVSVRGGPGKALDPIAGVEILIVDAQSQQPLPGAAGVTGADGTLKLTVKPTDMVQLVMTINGRSLPSEPLDARTQGFSFPITAQWPEAGGVEATFDAPPGKLVFAQATGDAVYRSRPFFTLAEVGASERISVFPRSPLVFEAISFTEDQQFVIQGSFLVKNFSWAPIRSGADGLLIALPKGHKGAVVGPQYQDDVAVAQGQGFRVTRPVPPRGIAFTAGWSQSISDGSVDVSMPMPNGAFRSILRIKHNAGMTVTPGAGLKGSIRRMSTGDDYFVMENILLQSGQPLQFSITGLPADAAWKRWMPRILGILVILLILGGIVFALTGSAKPRAASDTARREKLLEELVALEKRGIETAKDRARRDQLIDELESMWGQAA